MSLSVKQEDRVSKHMSWALRHCAELLAFDDNSGWVSIDRLLLNIREVPAQRDITVEDIHYIVEKCPKQRYTIDGSMIAANQGHSKVVAIVQTRAVPPEFLYHGTTSLGVQKIYGSCRLDKGRRQHVHLSDRVDLATSHANHRAKEYNPASVLMIEARKLHDLGHVFYISDNNVWLCDTIHNMEFVHFHHTYEHEICSTKQN